MKERVFELFITMEPVAKGRPRVTRQGHAFTPTKTSTAEFNVAQAVGAAWNKAPMAEPLELALVAYIHSPKHPKHKDFPVTRPDGDNYLKLVADGLNHVMWEDDSYLVNMKVYKRFVSEAYPHPGFRVIVNRVTFEEDEEF